MRIRLLIVAALLPACQGKDVFDPGWTRAVGVVEPTLSSIQMLSAPTTARRNVPFTIVVRTLGSSTCTRVQGTEVSVSGLNVDITPYDDYARKAPACTTDLRPFEHTASVTIATAGLARIRLHARTREGADMTYDAAVTVTE